MCIAAVIALLTGALVVILAPDRLETRSLSRGNRKQHEQFWLAGKTDCD